MPALALTTTRALRALVPLFTVTARPGIALAGFGAAVLAVSKAQPARPVIGSDGDWSVATLSTLMQRWLMMAFLPESPLTRQKGVIVCVPAASVMTAVAARASQYCLSLHDALPIYTFS